MRIAWTLVFLMLAACTAKPGAVIGHRPAEWNAGAELIGSSSSYSHKDIYTVLGGLNGAPPAGEPASCVAYRDAEQHRNDACTVRSPWAFEASWHGVAGGSSLGEPGFNVVVYDAAGKAVAWWHGSFTADASRTSQ